jgi:hypothetical protein
VEAISFKVAPRAFCQLLFFSRASFFNLRTLFPIIDLSTPIFIVLHCIPHISSEVDSPFYFPEGKGTHQRISFSSHHYTKPLHSHVGEGRRRNYYLTAHTQTTTTMDLSVGCEHPVRVAGMCAICGIAVDEE